MLFIIIIRGPLRQPSPGVSTTASPGPRRRVLVHDGESSSTRRKCLKVCRRRRRFDEATSCVGDLFAGINREGTYVIAV